MFCNRGRHGQHCGKCGGRRHRQYGGKAEEEPEPPEEPRIPDQWVENGEHLRLRSVDGKYRKGFALRRGRLYFFDSNGNLQTGWISFGGKTYYASRVHG